MKRYNYILPLVASLFMWGCQQFLEEGIDPSVDSSNSNVELLEDGRIRVEAALNSISMSSVESRATSYEDVIYNGWCLVFGEDEDNYKNQTGDYSDASPLIQVVPIIANSNGKFFMTFEPYENAAFMRIVVNLTDRENASIQGITSWEDIVFDTSKGYEEEDFQTPPDFNEVSEHGIATFGQYRYQSVGLDGIYDMDYNTAATVEYFDIAYDDLSESSTHWGVVYSNTDSNKQSGTNSIHGADETYNGNQPDPSSVKSTGFPMASYGFVMDDISEESLAEAVANTSTVDMIRVCSKVQVEVDAMAGFDMEQVYLIDGAQESRIRSTVLADVVTDDQGNTTTTTTSFAIPEDLGGTITYLPLEVEANATISDPIYFYPNSGGDYIYNDGAVNQGVNPQYIVIKGQASGYDTPGYYKVALKAQYPLADDSANYPTTNTEKWSTLTYDILRNTSFTVKLLNVDKPGYKTLADASNINSPANNISYSIDIETSDNRYEVLVSKGTYYTELETSRVYVKGYMDEGITQCYLDFTMYPSEGNVCPSVYVQSSDHDGNFDENEDVVITHCLVMREGDAGFDNDGWINDAGSSQRVELTDNETGDGLGAQLVHIEGSDVSTATKVRVYFNVFNSGRIRLRIGDILKFIPVTYDRAPISMYGTGEGNSVVVTGTYGTEWDDFSYSDIEYDTTYEGDTAHEYIPEFELNSDGSVTHDNTSRYTVKPELRARIYPADTGDGIAVLYLRQASNFRMLNAEGSVIPDDSMEETDYSVEYTAQSKVYDNDTGGLFETITNSDGTQYIEFTTASGGVSSESVDVVTITTSNTDTTMDDDGNLVQQDKYWNEVNDGQTLQLSATAITYDLNVTYTEFSNDFIQYDNTATTVITVTNSAGDTKTYTVKQTQHPPVYMVTNNYGTSKTYAMCYWSNIFSTRSITQDGCVIYALNIYNYDDSTNSGYTYTTSLATSGSDSDEMDIHLYPTLFGSSFVDSYNYSSDVSTQAIVSGKNNNGNTVSYAAGKVNEFDKQGVNANADVAIGVIRNYADVDDVGTSLSAYSATGNLTVTIIDKYGDTYTTTKTFSGI